MSTVTEIAQNAINAALDETNKKSLSEDALARALIAEAIAIYRKTRSANDIANELEFIAENIGDDEEYTFMRP
ncbi:hypothetical protein A9Q83_18050 [Alphaproteobacteria bacterium 46_93_T64]|nr:hypothetical protein A9Q83_18050 [Alphaproteobacteria bacterium 46_93_T64]